MVSNLDLVKAFYLSFKAKDKNAYLQLCDDNVEWTVMATFPNGGTHVGKKAVFEQYFPKLFSRFIEFHAYPEEFLNAGDNVIVLGKYTGIGKNSRKNFESPFAHIYTIKDGKIIKFRQYADTAKVQSVLNLI